LERYREELKMQMEETRLRKKAEEEKIKKEEADRERKFY